MVVLAGCENFARGPLSVRRSGEHLQIAVCDNDVVTKVTGTYRDPSDGTTYTSFVNAIGSVEVRSGDVWVSSKQLAGFRTALSLDPGMGPGRQVDIVVSTNPPENGFEGAFTFGPKGLSSTKWLHPDGSETKSPCPSSSND
jgi:hypothetical protein